MLHVYTQVFTHVKSGKVWKTSGSVDFTWFELWSGNVHNFSYTFL